MLNKSLKNGLSLQEQIQMQLIAHEEKKTKKQQEEVYQPYKEHPEYKKEEVGNMKDSGFEWPVRFNLEQRQILGLAIQEAREKRHISQSKLNDLAALPGQYVSRAERGEIAKIDKPIINKIAHILQSDFTDIVASLLDNNFRPVYGNPKASYVKQKEKAGFEPIKVKQYEREPIVVASVRPGLEFIKEHSVTLKAEGFKMKLKMDGDEYELSYYDQTGQNMQIYQGKRSSDDAFVQALEHIVTTIKVL